MQTQVMIQRVKMFLRDFYQYASGGKARRAREWEDKAYRAELDAIQERINRADRIKANRSLGAAKGWQTRRANAAAKRSEGNGVAGAVLREDTGGTSTVGSPAPQPPKGWEIVQLRDGSELQRPTQPDTWDDHDFDTVPSA